MGFIDDICIGYQYAQRRAEVLAQCWQQGRELGEEFLRGRLSSMDGGDVYAFIERAHGFESRMGGVGAKLTGYQLYQLLHPLQSYKDSCTVADIVMSEVRPV